MVEVPTYRTFCASVFFEYVGSDALKHLFFQYDWILFYFAVY